MNKNWAGLTPHKTDEYVHWSSEDPITEMNDLRQLWNDVATNGTKESLETLLDAAYQAGRQEVWDDNAGEDI